MKKFYIPMLKEDPRAQKLVAPKRATANVL